MVHYFRTTTSRPVSKPVTVERPETAEEEAQLDAAAIAEDEAGETVEHEKVRLWLDQLAGGNFKAQPPL